MFLWTAYFWTDDTPCRYQDFQLGVAPVLCCSFLIALIGHKAEKLGTSLRREGFEYAVYMTVSLLTYMMGRVGEYLLNLFVEEPLNTGSGFGTVVIVGAIVICGVIGKPSTELAMTIHYRFTTRQIPALYWLPQNGAQGDFEPWWSRQLRYTMLCYICLLMHVLLAAIDVGANCRLSHPSRYDMTDSGESPRSLFILS